MAEPLTGEEPVDEIITDGRDIVGMARYMLAYQGHEPCWSTRKNLSRGILAQHATVEALQAKLARALRSDTKVREERAALQARVAELEAAWTEYNCPMVACTGCESVKAGCGDCLLDPLAEGEEGE